MRLNLGFEATLSHSFGELKLPLSQTTLVRVVAVKAQTSLVLLAHTQLSPFRFQFSVYLVCLTALYLVAAWIDEQDACVLIVALQLNEDVVERRAVGD